jgi:hypothetical protein
MLKLFEKYKDKNWNKDELSKNPNIPIEYILNHSEINWNYDNVLMHPHCNQEYFDILVNKYNANPKKYIYNKNLDFNIILQNNNVKWDYNYLSQHPKITLKMIEDYNELPWNFLWLSCNPNLNIDFIKNNDTSKFDFDSLTMFMDINDILNNSQLPWVYDLLSYNSNLTFNILKSFKNIVFDYESILENMNMSEIFKMIKNPFYDVHYNQYWICRNNSLVINDIYKLGGINCTWNFYDLSHHINISMDFVNQYNDLEWNFNQLSKNPNITESFIKENLDNINFNELSTNYLDYIHVLDYCENKFKTSIKNSKIEEELIIKTWHPSRFQDWCLSNNEFED